MILIADSGSTKTTWCTLEKETGKTEFIQTAGINPFYQNEETIVEALEKEFKLPHKQFEAIYFYSAGCTNPEISQVAGNSLSQFFESQLISVESDLMAAAHALCGDTEGIACILGTGSNSCHYKDGKVVENVSPLGFILGDEGSGAVIGKKFLADVLKNQLPEKIKKKFLESYNTSAPEILNSIYKKPFPNRYAAQFTRFIAQNIDEPALQELVADAFDQFLTRNVLQYNHATTLPIHFTGSIAFYFKEILQQTLTKRNLKMGDIIKDPMPGLIEYHKNH